MAVAELQSTIENATATLADWNSFIVGISSLEGPDRSLIDLEKPLPNFTPPTSIKLLGTKLTGAIGLIHNLTNIESLELIPDSVVADVVSKTAALRAVVAKILAQLSSLDKDNDLASLDPATLMAADQKGQQLNLPPLFAELYPSIQNLLISLYQMRSMSRLTEEGGFALQLSQIDAARSAQHRAYGELNRLRRATDASRKRLDSIVSAATLTSDEITALKARAAGATQEAEAEKAKAEEIVAEATPINAAAGKLKESVDAYQSSFIKFQADLDARNVMFIKGKSDLETLLLNGEAEQSKLLSEKTKAHERLLGAIALAEKEMDRLLARSREVLGEATVSGLSESFAREMKKTGRQLANIQFLFFFSIASLLVSVGIVLNAFPWIEQWVRTVRFEPPPNADSITVAVFYFGNFLSKLTFLLPSLILLFYAARRYTEVFRLKTQYTYKYTVAASLPGFKIEAPAYAEAITASAFKELLFNPGEQAQAPEDKSDGSGNTFLQRLIEPVVQKAINKMGEIPKSPN